MLILFKQRKIVTLALIATADSTTGWSIILVLYLSKGADILIKNCYLWQAEWLTYKYFRKTD